MTTYIKADAIGYIPGMTEKEIKELLQRAMPDAPWSFIVEVKNKWLTGMNLHKGDILVISLDVSELPDIDDLCVVFYKKDCYVIPDEGKWLLQPVNKRGKAIGVAEDVSLLAGVVRYVIREK